LEVLNKALQAGSYRRRRPTTSLRSAAGAPHRPRAQILASSAGHANWRLAQLGISARTVEVHGGAHHGKPQCRSLAELIRPNLSA
jgi:FixJ family two-component response regulator